MDGTEIKWGQAQRLEFIEFRLLWSGRVNRGDLTTFFGISVQQASIDLGRYTNLAPSNLVYDKNEKTYKRLASFRVALLPFDARYYLEEMKNVATGAIAIRDTFVPGMPSCGVVEPPQRDVKPDVLFGLLAAVSQGEDVRIGYQSMRRATGGKRWIRPHAFAYDGLRWHARGWCHENGDFRDFVLSRISDVGVRRNSTVDVSRDSRWHNTATIVLTPRGTLTSHQRTAVEAEFGMRGGELRIQIREALVFYFVRLMHLTDPATRGGASQPICWKNREKFAGLIAEAMR